MYMITLIIVIFIFGYVAIAFEHPLKLNKAASALITGVLCWTVYVLGNNGNHEAHEALITHLGDISSILFFLLGAMTVVELIDMHSGFDFITQKIKTKKKPALLLLVAALTFFLSALLDNLTTAIVMVSLSSKLLTTREDRLWFAGMIVIAANAGGAWSPLGDVTTTMLWIGRQITALSIIKQLLLPSMVVCIVPALIMAYRFRGKTIEAKEIDATTEEEKQDGRIMLFTGIGLLLFVPVFKSLTGLPPFMGMLLALGMMWIVTTRLHQQKETALAQRLTVTRALEKIDTSSILFFLGILLAVSALQSAGVLKELALFLSRNLHNDYSIGIALGLLSSVVDNVPLVAAAQGMYDLATYPTDHMFWEFLALTTGTGGSAIIIGSAAGVAVMGIEQVDFGWYLKRISWLALVGFAAGVLVYIIQHQLQF